MSISQFTDEQIALLKANPYTYHVTARQIAFTKEFKEIFWTEYQNRMTPRNIFKKYGYDTDILGATRITGFQQSLKRETEAGLPFYEGSRPPGLKKELISNDDGSPTAETFKDMQHRLEYLEQEMDFLKKIISTRNTRKQVHCS